MLTNIFRALADLIDPRIIGLLLRSLLVTLVIFVLVGVALGWALTGSDPCGMFGGEIQCTLDATGSSVGALVFTLLGIWFLFPAIALGVICAYLDRIAAIIEARHYPLSAARARSTGVVGALMMGLRSTARVIIFNLLALPFDICLLVTGIGPVILFVIVNGAAFGRDLGEMVAARHGDRESQREWLALSTGGRMAIGTLVTAIFLVPFVNLLAPVLGVSLMTHFYLNGRSPG